MHNDQVSDRMPDVASVPGEHVGRIDWVGMSNVEMLVKLSESQDVRQLNAKSEIYVSLSDEQLRGIHMSRLYLLLDGFSLDRVLSPASLVQLLGELRESHQDMSDAAYVAFDFELPLRRPALLSEHSGWRHYPCRIVGRVADNGKPQLYLVVKLAYSSACPCSFALVRQQLAEQFAADFSSGQPIDAATARKWLEEDGDLGISHSQRSCAEVHLAVDGTSDSFGIQPLVEGLEKALGTVVQTAVKREDEQEFARLNGQSPMFVEDASRLIASHIRSHYQDFWVRVDHYESLHAHDASAVIASPQGRPAPLHSC